MRANLSAEDNKKLEDLLHNLSTISDVINDLRKVPNFDRAAESDLLSRRIDVLVEVWKLWPTYIAPDLQPVVREYVGRIGF